MAHNAAREARSASKTELLHLWEVGLASIVFVLPAVPRSRSEMSERDEANGSSRNKGKARAHSVRPGADS